MEEIRIQPKVAMIHSYHEPVLVTETLDALRVIPNKLYIDATLGGGGHAVGILKRGGRVLGIDTDRDALTFAKNRFQTELETLTEGKEWNVTHGNFRDIEAIAKREAFSPVDGVLFDLGVSSHQINTPERGFSYRYPDAPLDLRLDQSQGESAEALIARINEEELYELFATFGEEERAGTIAHAVVRARSLKAITTVGDLIESISSVGIAQSDLPGVLSRIFQAIRIAINDELRSLQIGIVGAGHVLVPGGRIAIISFHSLEDRIVKRMLLERTWAQNRRKPITPGLDEIARNKRSRSAKLRLAEKI